MLYTYIYTHIYTYAQIQHLDLVPELQLKTSYESSPPCTETVSMREAFDCDRAKIYILYSLLHLECHSNSISNLNLPGLFSTERGKRGLEN